MRKKILFANWKMNKNINDSISFIKKISKIFKTLKTNKIIFGIAPNFLALAEANKISKKINIISQNVHFLDNGAYTGEISAKMLKNIGINYSIVGHSERRKYFNENNQTSNFKIKKLLSLNMIPIYCCGETLEIYKKNKINNYIEKQIREGLSGIQKKNIKNIIIAYEPAQAIGNGKNVDGNTANKICGFIRKIIKNIYDLKTSLDINIIYGGSVNEKNIKMYLNCQNIDGFLIGKASLKINSLKKIILNVI